MKKFYLILMGVAVLSFATLSCSKEALDPSQQEQNQKEETVKEEPSGDTPVPEGMIRLTFGVSQEGDASANEGDDTKTFWDGTTHGWSEGDQIRIIFGEGDVEGTDYKDAEVVGGKVIADVPVRDDYYAVYPTTATYTFTATEGKISVSFGRNQGGTFKDANIMVAKTSKDAAHFSFKNMTSILKFTTAAGSPYTKIDFAANDKERLNGTVSTTFPEDPAEFAVKVTPDSKNDGQIVSTNIAADGTYYLAVLPGTTLSNGIGFKVTKSGAQSTGSLSTSELSMERRAIRTLPVPIDDLIHESWFITEKGRGEKDGTSWENAGDAARLVQLIYPTQTRGAGQGLTAAWRLHKATIYVAAGTYNIQAANSGNALAPSYNTSTLTATIKGGYPTGLSGTTTTVQDPQNNATKFISNQAIANDRIFYAKDCQLCNWTFDGITFTSNPDAVNKDTRGVAFFFNSATSGTLTFRQCIFTELESDSELGGAALDFNSTGKLDVTFDRCLFKDNVTSGANAGYGGTIVIEQGDQTTIELIDCEADNNDVTSTNGQGGFLCQKAATVNIQGTTIKNSDSKANGGAIFQQGGVLNISAGTDSTKFISNKADGKRGGAILCQGELNIDKAAFRSNNGSNGGAIHLEAGAKVVISNSTFKGNTATNGGAIRSSGSVVLNIDNATFTKNTATNGGGIALEYDTDASVNVTNSIFRANSNSAILNKGAMKVVGCVFESNSTGDKGSAIYTTGANGKTAIAKIFNSQFEGNESTPTDGSGSNMKGCTVITGSNAYALVANSTFSGNIEHSMVHGVISPGTNTNTKVYVVSSTLSENLFSDGSSTSAGPDFARTTPRLLVYNTISTNTAESIANVVVQNSIFKLRCFKDNRNTFEDLAAFGLGTYSNGVYPLDATYSDAYNKGMEVAEILALTYDGNIDLTKEEKDDLLANDQKGNSREGKTTMGAYVGE